MYEDATVSNRVNKMASKVPACHLCYVYTLENPADMCCLEEYRTKNQLTKVSVGKENLAYHYHQPCGFDVQT